MEKVLILKLKIQKRYKIYFYWIFDHTLKCDKFQSKFIKYMWTNVNFSVKLNFQRLKVLASFNVLKINQIKCINMQLYLKH